MPSNRVYRLKPSPQSPGSMRGVLDKLSQAIAAHQSRLDALVAQHEAAQNAHGAARRSLEEALSTLATRVDRLEAHARDGGAADS